MGRRFFLFFLPRKRLVSSLYWKFASAGSDKIIKKTRDIAEFIEGGFFEPRGSFPLESNWLKPRIMSQDELPSDSTSSEITASEPTASEPGAAVPTSAESGVVADKRTPDRATLVGLALIAAVTWLGWGSARLACNRDAQVIHAPGQLSDERMAVTPRDAAIEFHQRLWTGEFEGALEFATGSAIKFVEAERAKCPSDHQKCENQSPNPAKTVTVVEVVEATDSEAEVRIISVARIIPEKRITRYARLLRLEVNTDSDKFLLWRVAEISDQPLPKKPAIEEDSTEDGAAEKDAEEAKTAEEEKSVAP